MEARCLNISAYLERHRLVYYERLLAVSRDGDWNIWIAFFLRAIEEQAGANGRKVKAILDLYDEVNYPPNGGGFATGPLAGHRVAL